MIRIKEPTPTRGAAPSHSPPDTRYSPGIGLARALGWVSIGLGVAELVAPRTMADLTGVRRPKLLWAYGLRELACGVGILSSSRPTTWMWARVAGDAIDLATLGEAYAEGGGERQRRALAATAAVAGAMALDLLCGAQLTAASKLEG